MLRLILIAIIVYLAFKLVQNLLSPGTDKQSRVEGQANKNNQLDLTNNDIEDAKYEDLEE